MFEIAWMVNKSEWEKATQAASEHAPGSQYDREYSAHYYLLRDALDSGRWHIALRAWWDGYHQRVRPGCWPSVGSRAR
jgi:hypothetical protein